MPQSLPLISVAVYVLAALAVILVAARLVGGLFVRIGQPRVVGETISGILIGPTVLGGTLAAASRFVGTVSPMAGTGLSGLFYPAEALAFLNVFGVLALVLFTFLVGMEVPQQLLKGSVGRLTLIGVSVVGVSVGLGFALALVLDEPGLWRAVQSDGRPVPALAHALLIAGGIAATALPVIARILQDKGLVATPVGALGIGAAGVVTPLTFLIVAAVSAVMTGADVWLTTVVRVALTLALIVLLFAVVRPLLARILRRRFRADEGLDSGLLATLLVGALLTGMVADLIGIQAFTGSLLFGAAVPQVAGLARAVAARLQQVVVVLGIPVFLAVSGLQTDLRTVRPEHLAAVALFLIAIAVAKFGVGSLIGRLTGLPAGESGAVGVLMACGGLVTLVVAVAARQIGVITPSMQAVFVLTAIMSTLVTGPLLDRFLAAAPVLAPEAAVSDRAFPG